MARIALANTAKITLAPNMGTAVLRPGDASGAAASAAAAAASAAAAAAVGSTNDTIIAGRVNDGASSTRAALEARYGGVVNLKSFGAVGDGTTDDTSAIAAAIAAIPAGSHINLNGLTHKTTSAITLNKALRISNGKIAAGNHNALVITASGVVLDRGLTLSRGTGSAVTDTIAARCIVSASAPFLSDGVAYTGTAHSCVYLTHNVCSGTTIRGGTMVNNTAVQDSAGVYVAAGGTGNNNIKIDGVTVSGSCSNGVVMFDSNKSRVINCDVGGMTILPTVTLTGWTLVSGNIYKQRTAPGSPGTTGVSTDRVDGNTRVVRQGATLLVENSSTPTTPGASKWGESGGFVYIDLGGTDPNTQTITSDIVSGYGVTLYSTANGFTDMSQNIVAQNTIHDVDGFGIYMQLSNYANTCIDNKTIGNTLTNVCLKGSQTTILPFAGLSWNGGTNCLSMGDHIDGIGTSGLPAPGFYASDAGVICRGRAIGVVVSNSFGAEGFRCNDASEWQYIGCAGNTNATNGFKALLNASRVIRGLQFNGCTATGNTLAGLSLDASASGAVCSATIIGGTYYSNTQQGIILNGVRDTYITGTVAHDNGSTSFPQVRFVGNCLNCGVDGLSFYHSLAGASFQLAASQTTAFFLGKISIPSNMAAINLGSNVVQIAGGAGVAAEYSGSGAPGIAGALGDRYRRIDTPSTANQREYVCTTAGAAGVAVWTGIL